MDSGGLDHIVFGEGEEFAEVAELVEAGLFLGGELRGGGIKMRLHRFELGLVEVAIEEALERTFVEVLHGVVLLRVAHCRTSKSPCT